MQAIIQMQDGSLAKVNVYRNGDTVTVVGMGKHNTPAGVAKAAITLEMNVATFQWYRSQAIKRMGTLAYTRLLGRFGIDDNVMHAPPLPAAGQSPRRMLGR